MGPPQKQSLKFFCALEVVLPAHACRSPGVGMAQELLDQQEEGLFPLCVGSGVEAGRGGCGAPFFFPFFLKFIFSDVLLVHWLTKLLKP